MTILGASSDHLVVEVGDHAVSVGDELTFGLGYGALVRAMTSPFVTQQIAVATRGAQSQQEHEIETRWREQLMRLQKQGGGPT